MEFLEGVRAQPANLERSLAVVRSALDEADPITLMGRGTLAAVGMGASTHAATVFVAELRRRGRAAYVVSAGELLDTRGEVASRYVGISYSGRSTETVTALSRVAGPVRVGLTNFPERQLGSVVDHVIPLGCGEDTRVSTLSYTATLQALGLLVERSSSLTGGGTVACWPVLHDRVAKVLATAPGAGIAALFAGVTSVDVIGSGHRHGSAGAAALLLRESVHLPTAAYQTAEYLHGPLEVAAPGRGCLLFGSGREIQLAGELADWGSPTVLVTDAERLPAGLERDNLLVVTLPPLGDLAGTILDILPVQLAAVELAERRGIPIALRHMPDDTKLPAPGTPDGGTSDPGQPR